MMTRHFLCLMAATLFTCVSLSATELVWFEAEDFDRSNWPGGASGSGPFAAKDDAKLMVSEGAWLNAAGGSKGLFIEKEIDIPADGKYIFYARLFGNWGGGSRTGFRFRVNDGAWVDLPTKSGKTLEFVKPTKVSTLSWVQFEGRHQLSAGKQAFRLEVTDNEQPAAFDCFVFTTDSFSPSGTLKPGQKLGLADDGKWAFEPDADTFSDEALLDLRYLNEQHSGQDGWIHLSDDGEQLLLGSGRPVKLWSGEYRGGDLEDCRKQLRFLAKRGFNAVRYFRPIWPTKEGQGLHEVNYEVRDHLWNICTAARENGIYVLFTPIWCKTAFVRKEWNIPEYQKWDTHRDARHALFTNLSYREAYRSWMKQTLTEKNPHTGIALADDPTLYCVQLQNEDSIFWSGLGWGLTEEGKRAICKRFGDWLIEQYGSIDKALAAWGSPAVKGSRDFFDDALDKGEVGLPKSSWQLTSGWANGRSSDADKARCFDAVRFLAHVQRSFNDEMRSYLKDELGYKGLISANNWKTKDRTALEDIERWSYSGCEIIATNKYVGVHHVNPTDNQRVGYQVNKNDLFIDDVPLQVPALLPTNYKMVQGHPHIITESTWVAPRSYHAEGPLLLAAYASLTGLDSYNWFTVSGRWSNNLGKWDAAIPGVQAGFPAAALMYRRGDVSEPEPVVVEDRALNDLWQRKQTIIAESTSYDPNQDSDYAVSEVSVKGGLDPLAFEVGPVRVRYAGEKSAHTTHSQLNEHIDRQAKTVSSITGELKLQYGTGMFTCDTPRSQGATGLFKDNGGRVELSDLIINSQDHYACVIVTSLDDKPLKSSGKVLVQVTTTSRPYGYRQENGTFSYKKGKKDASITGQRIAALGSMPWNLMKTDIGISLANSTLTKATQLDANGMAAGELKLQRGGKGIELKLPEDVLYVILQ